MDATVALAASTGFPAACASLGVSRATLYRRRPLVGPSPAPSPPPSTLRQSIPPQRALTLPERERVLSVLHQERFEDCAPATVHATLLDEGQYLCSCLLYTSGL